MFKKNIFILFIIVLVVGGCKSSTEKKIIKTERKIEKKKELIEKSQSDLAGLNQQLVYLKKELAQEQQNPSHKINKTIDKKQAEITKLQNKIKEINLSIYEARQQMDTTTIDRDDLLKVVTVFKPEIKEFKKYIELQGKVSSKENIIVSSEAGGQILSIPVTEGQSVSKGQVLASLDQEVMKNNISELETALNLANQVYERQARLWEQKIGSEIQYLQAKNNKESLEKKLETLKSQSSKMIIRAPFNGIIDKVFARSGELAGPGSAIARVVNLNTVQVVAEVPESYIGKIKKGDKVEVYFPSLEETRVANVKSISQVINPGNRTFNVEAILNNPGGVLKPNQLSNLKLIEYASTGKYVIPSRLVQHDSSSDYVYIVNGQNKVKKVLIKSGRTYQGQTEVLEGLSGDEKIIEKGFKDVVEDDVVEIVQ
jgi:RND family efflux transporter MFP subunit